MSWFSSFYPKKTVFHSKINGEIVLVEFFSKKTLYVKGAPQSGGEFVFMWQKVIEKIKDQSFDKLRTSSFDKTQDKQSKIKNCLILGIGGGTIIHILKKSYPNISITGVEIDPIMLEVARKYFDLTPEVIDDIIIADAYSWIEKYKEKQSFDLIAVDLFIGKLNPFVTRQKKYLLKLKKLLTQSGVILYNAHYQPQEPLEFKKFVKTCKAIFTQVEEVFHFPYNRVLLLE